MQLAKSPKGPKGNLFFERGFNVRTTALHFLMKSIREYPHIYRVKAGFIHLINITKPEYIEHVLSDSVLYDKGDDNKNLKLLLGNGLLTSEGSFWLKQRRLIQPIFHKRKLEGFAQKIVESVQEMKLSWQNCSGETLNFHSEMSKVALSVVSKTLMSTDASGDSDKVNGALTQAMVDLGLRISNPIRLPEWVPLPLHTRIKKNRAVLDEIIFGIINDRRTNKKQVDDLLSMLMEVQDADTSEQMTDEQLRDEVFTIFVAGFETTANALSFAFYLLAKHPEVRAKIAEEVTRVLNGNAITYENLFQLDYTTRVIKEVMRLYPPAWIIGRQATKDDVIDGHLIKKGERVIISPFAVHHSEIYWTEPEKFDPDRFLTERFKPMHRYTYFPFGGGARFCIGNNFAMMEMQIVVALACQDYNFKVAEGFELELETLITLRPMNGVLLTIEKI